MPAAETLQILLLGPPDVRWEGKTWKITRRLQRALLFYLAEVGSLSRDELGALFWPEEKYGDKARANLRVGLARLRKELPSEEFLETSRNIIALNQARVMVDANHFTRLVSQPLHLAAQLPAQSPLPAPTARVLQQAAELWRSSHFMEGFAFPNDNPELDHWQMVTGRHFEETNLRVRARLSAHFAAVGDLDTAIHWAQSALEIDPYADDLHVKVIRWLLALDRAGNAIHYVHVLQERYQSEGVEFSEELKALFPLAHQQGITQHRNVATEEWPELLLAQVPLVSRQSELSTLQAAYRRGGMMVVRGEAGSGKTRLAYELYRSLQPVPRLLVINGIQGESSLQFQPLIDTLRRSIRQEEWRRLAVPWLAQMATWLPELGESLQVTPAPLDPSAEVRRGNLFEALRQLLLEISQTRRALIVLDGAQWCDEATLAALGYLFDRHFFAERGLWLVNARLVERSPLLEQIIVQKHNSALFQQMTLPRLDAAAAGELARHVLGHALPEPLAERLSAQTGGNPLFMLETLYDLLEYTPDSISDLAWGNLPVSQSLHNLLRDRVDLLHPQTRQIVAAAAIFNESFTPALLSALTLFEPEWVARGLDELQQAQLVRPLENGAQATYTFIHGHAREVIRWGQGAAHLRLLHLRAARALERELPATPLRATRQAWHYEAAGEALSAIRCWVEAGIRARMVFSASEALLAFQSAEALARRIPDELPEELAYPLYEAWIETTFEQNDPALMREISTRLLHIAETRKNLLLLGVALGGQAMSYSLEGDAFRARELFERAAVHLRQLRDPFSLAKLTLWQARHQIRLLHFDEAIEMLEQTLAKTDAQDPRGEEVCVACQYALGLAYLVTGWPRKAEATALLSLREDETPALVFGRLVMAGAKYFQGEHTAALEHVRLGLQIAHSLNSPRLIGFFYLYQLQAELAIGQVDATWARQKIAFEHAQTHQFHDMLSILWMVRGDVYRLLGDSEAAIPYYEAGIAEGQSRWDSLMCQVHLARALADVERYDEAVRQAEGAYQEARDLNLGVVFIPARLTYAELMARTGRIDDAIILLEEQRALIQERHYGSSVFIESRILAMAARQRGDLEEARRQIQIAIQDARQRSNPWWELRGYRVLKALGGVDGRGVERVNQLLAIIDQRNRHPDLQSQAEAFLNKARAEFLS